MDKLRSAMHAALALDLETERLRTIERTFFFAPINAIEAVSCKRLSLFECRFGDTRQETRHAKRVSTWWHLAVLSGLTAAALELESLLTQF
jgi:hypothetical protein